MTCWLKSPVLNATCVRECYVFMENTWQETINTKPKLEFENQASEQNKDKIIANKQNISFDLDHSTSTRIE